MTMDVLAVPISGAGVECLSSAAQQICSYKRNRLLAKTIKRLMILRYALEREKQESLTRADKEQEWKKKDEQKKVESQADITLAASLDISDTADRISEEDECEVNQAAGFGTAKGQKRIASQVKTSGHQRKPRKLDYIAVEFHRYMLLYSCLVLLPTTCWFFGRL